jgi:hypothetical protein
MKPFTTVCPHCGSNLSEDEFEAQVCYECQTDQMGIPPDDCQAENLPEEVVQCNAVTDNTFRHDDEWHQRKLAMMFVYYDDKK